MENNNSSLKMVSFVSKKVLISALMENKIVTFLQFFFVFLLNIIYTEKWYESWFLLVYFTLHFQYKHGSMI